MASAIVLSGPDSAPPRAGCRCVKNKRTKRGVLLCPVPRSAKHRSGYKFTGPCQP